MNAASLKSARLQRVLTVLSDGKPHSTWSIMRRAKVCAVNSCIAELRCLGARIDCETRLEGPERERRFYYTMKKGPRTDG
ncbi:hypothetical protein [Salipiger mucosus]|uniref:Helix-turn-helix domain-containing protein n=1 Tax=Salipiger mucosus DSM 16094 TaxID=1123237 RepID=S9RVX1_9RHOB|nr:hypothetical protein [Salipiger mucosus]EPX78119.1 hypothetical protein Salmuc_04466 [Salipiger mucosus DSM 16094]